MALTNLTGWTWQANDTLTNLDLTEFTYNIDFECHNVLFDKFIWSDPTDQYTSLSDYKLIYYSDDVVTSYDVVSNLTWQYDWAKSIEIVGGDDATSASANFAGLLSWLQAHGTLIPGAGRIEIDLTTLVGWDVLEYGTHSITIVAEADGYTPSEPSEAVTVTKLEPFATPTIALTGSVLSTPIVEDVTQYKVHDGDEYIGYVDSDNTWHSANS